MNKLYQETIAIDFKINRELLRTKMIIAKTNPELVTPLLFTEKKLLHE